MIVKKEFKKIYAYFFGFIALALIELSAAPLNEVFMFIFYEGGFNFSWVSFIIYVGACLVIIL